MIKLLQGDCLKRMAEIPDKSIDMVLADPPYGTTACKWDSVIPLEPMWEHLKRVIKPNGAIVMTAREPFTSALIMSNISQYKHKWVWNKKQSGSFQTAKYMPLQIEEDILVFGTGRLCYYPIMRTGIFRKRGGANKASRVVGAGLTDGFENYGDQYYPTNIIELINPRRNKLHPTQKPVALMEYLIKTYTNEGDAVLDFVMGSGTTGVACKHLGRNFIGIELDAHYFEIAKNRIASTGEPLFVL